MTVARTPDLHVTITADTSKLDAAMARYQQALEDLASITPCTSQYPADPAGPDYLGTRCQLLDGHEKGDAPTPHRHRMLGSQVVVTW